MTIRSRARSSAAAWFGAVVLWMSGIGAVAAQPTPFDEGACYCTYRGARPVQATGATNSMAIADGTRVGEARYTRMDNPGPGLSNATYTRIAVTSIPIGETGAFYAKADEALKPSAERYLLGVFLTPEFREESGGSLRKRCKL